MKISPHTNILQNNKCVFWWASHNLLNVFKHAVIHVCRVVLFQPCCRVKHTSLWPRFLLFLRIWASETSAGCYRLLISLKEQYVQSWYCVASLPPQYGCQLELEHVLQGASKMFLHVCWPMATLSREEFRVRLVGSCLSMRTSATLALVFISIFQRHCLYRSLFCFWLCWES